MNTDRELLELAAKAAGIELHFDEDGPNEVAYYGATKTWSTWNPLADDGDALRLAAQLRISLIMGERTTLAADSTEYNPGVREHNGTDPAAAARRAIVKAAAELGRAK
jgi:hypothetical protein